MKRLMLILFLSGCATEQETQQATDVSGLWSYTWQVRNCPQDCPGHETWDGRFNGTLTLEQDGYRLTGSIGYPTEDLAKMYNDPSLLPAWIWTVEGWTDGATIELHAPAPNTAWDDPWDFVLDQKTMTGPAYPITSQGRRESGWQLTLSRQ